MRCLLPLIIILLCALSATAQTPRPILISQSTSTRAIAFESPSFKTEPFSLNSQVPWVVDNRTRVMIFAQNLTLAPGEELSAVTVEAEDAGHRLYNFRVEYVGAVPGQEWLSAIVVRLSDDLSAVGDVLLRVRYRGQSSNRVRIGIGHTGGGPPDDPGSAPTPAPPYFISGRVTVNGLGLADIMLSLSGAAQSITIKTDGSGAYSFTLDRPGSYTVTPSAPFYTFTPQSVAFDFLTGSQANINFVAVRDTYSISGQVKEANSSPVANMPVMVSGNSKTQIVMTDAQGFYTFPSIDGGYDYTVSTESAIFTFPSQAVAKLSSNTQINFQATRYLYTISGQLTDADSSVITDFAVVLSGNSTTQTAVTNYQGVFIFQNLEAGRDYELTPVSDNVFAFSREAHNLSSNLQFNITPERRTYAIGGRVLEGAKPVSGASVSLNGWTALNTTTDANGSYLFPNLQAGRSYTVRAAKTPFDVAPQFYAVDSLQNNREFDFTGTPTYHLTGRVIDDRGKGLADATLTLNGAESAVALTANDGTYSFTLHSTGDYTLTASTDQNFFTFSPATQNLTAVSGDRTINFVGTFSLATNPSYVLEFDGTLKTVDCGVFWPEDRPLGHFFWEVWAAPGADAAARYMISDGAGGTHAILFGFGENGKVDPNRYQLLGNFWTGVGGTSVYFGGDDGPVSGEWGHVSVGWDGQQIVTYFNGVPVGRVPYSGQRWRIGQGGGGGKLLIGGSDHNNLSGRIAQLRGYEEMNPREAGSVTAAFAPEILFSREGSYLGYFFRPSENIADMSNYYQGQAHRGRLRGVIGGVFNECPTCPLPQFVIDPTAPKFLEGSPVNTSAPVAVPSLPPSGALVYDSFSRANSTYTFGKGGLGSTEGGSAGPRQWQTIQEAGLDTFGILNGRAVILANGPALAWVQTNSPTPNVSINVDRRVAYWGSGLDTGLAFRVNDTRNFFFAYTSAGENDTAQSRKLTIGYFRNGIRTELVKDVSVPGLWARLEVISRSDGEITVLTNIGPVLSINNTFLANVTGAGLFNNAPGRSLVNRWDNFTVYNIP